MIQASKTQTHYHNQYYAVNQFPIHAEQHNIQVYQHLHNHQYLLVNQFDYNLIHHDFLKHQDNLYNMLLIHS